MIKQFKCMLFMVYRGLYHLPYRSIEEFQTEMEVIYYLKYERRNCFLRTRKMC